MNLLRNLQEFGKRRSKHSLFITILIFAVSIFQGSIAHSGEPVTAGAYGDDWPFPFQSAEVACDPPGNSVVLRSDGKTYALNGKALGQIDKRGYLDHRDLMPRDADGYFLRGVSTVSDLIQKGLKHCNP